MSYSRSYHESIRVSGSVSETFSYPASENGGSETVTVYYEEDVPVNVNIEVDTYPFDSSVSDCNTNVNLLTGAVVATEAAQVVSIRKNSRKVADSIITGFFDYIRSEISQQISELTQSIDAQLMHLRELSLSCKSKKVQMENDFNRITERYIKIFGDLNNELSNRIHEMERPAFSFKNESQRTEDRFLSSGGSNVAGIHAMESALLQTRISTSITKRRASNSIDKAGSFIFQQKRLNEKILESSIPENTSATYFSPVCIIEYTQEGQRTERECISPGKLPVLNSSLSKEKIFDGSDLMKVPGFIIRNTDKQTQLYFNNYLSASYASQDPHTKRVKALIQQFSGI